MWLLLMLGATHVLASSLACAVFYTRVTRLGALLAAQGIPLTPAGWAPYASEWTEPILLIGYAPDILAGPALLPLLFHIGFAAMLLALPRSIRFAKVR